MGQTLPQMGLATWNQLLDLYNFQQLANDLNIINFHDHSPGKGVPIPAGGLAPGSVGPRELISGTWAALTLATNVTSVTNAYVPSALVELGGEIRLKGKLLNNTGSAIAIGTTWATIPSTPAGLQPTDTSAQGVVVVGSYSTGSVETPICVLISSSGHITCNFAVISGQYLSLDGITFTVS